MTIRKTEKFRAPDPNSFDEKEVFTFFGLAAYYAQTLEQGVLNLAMGLHLGKTGPITRELIDELYHKFEVKTLGSLIKSARSAVPISSRVEKDLESALRSRNYLTHQFFSKHTEDFISETGRREMIAELRDITEKLEAIDRTVELLYGTVWSHYGITPEMISQGLEEMVARANARDRASNEKNL